MDQVPMQFKDRWEAANEELAQASIEINTASVRYNKAILARLALRQLMNENK